MMKLATTLTMGALCGAVMLDDMADSQRGSTASKGVTEGTSAGVDYVEYNDGNGGSIIWWFYEHEDWTPVKWCKKVSETDKLPSTVT